MSRPMPTEQMPAMLSEAELDDLALHYSGVKETLDVRGPMIADPIKVFIEDSRVIRAIHQARAAIQLPGELARLRLERERVIEKIQAEREFAWMASERVSGNGKEYWGARFDAVCNLQDAINEKSCAINVSKEEWDQFLIRSGRDTEREKVVAWLRNRAAIADARQRRMNTTKNDRELCGERYRALAGAADAIQRGEHVKGAT